MHLLLKGLVKIFPSLEVPVVCIVLAVGLFYVVSEWRKRIRSHKTFIWVKGVIAETGAEMAIVRYDFDGKTYTAEVEYHPDLLKKDIGKTVKLAINPDDIREVHISQRSQDVQLWAVTILLGGSFICFIVASFLYLLGD